ncbi:MAG: dienelactone hydrolase family protein [Bacteroidales bacterium]|nr:dienelactone hydrolase family protein [Bacteroidales bacterium]MDT8430326.1 dienelactone hydrolase family protein [Bacteroidales bacterium]
MYWLKTQNRIGPFSLLQRHLVVLLVMVAAGANMFAQPDNNTVTLYSHDSLMLTADEYVLADTLPYLVLLHEQGSSRGEFTSIIHRFQKMNFNCLVPDLRNGGNSGFVANETAKRTRNGKYGKKAEDIEGDIRTAINYAVAKSGSPVVLVGGGANGSLALKACKELDSVKAAIALSPGEFFRSEFSVEDTIAGIEKPILVVSSRMEFPYMEQLLSGVDVKYKELFTPDTHEGQRGTGALTAQNPSQSEYWLAILLFFKELK